MFSNQQGFSNEQRLAYEDAAVVVKWLARVFCFTDLRRSQNQARMYLPYDTREKLSALAYYN